jgi:Na+/H+-translocating membrane pyrophosphatase
LLFGVVGCSSVSTAPTQNAASHASSTPSTDVTGPKVIGVPGYTYSAVPPELKHYTDGLDATGMVTATVGRGVHDGSGALVAAIFLMQYNPKLTPLLDKSSPSQILDGSAKAVGVLLPGKNTVTAHVLSGNQVRLVHGTKASIAIAYRHGGQLIQVIGPTPAAVLSFTGAYLAASANP